MNTLIQKLRQPVNEGVTPSAQSIRAHIDTLRAAAAGALIETATALTIAKGRLEDGSAVNDPRVLDMISSARDSIRDGGNLSAVLDLDLKYLPENSFPRRLLRFNDLPARCQTGDRLAAASKLGVVDAGLALMLTHTSTFSPGGMITAIDAVLSRCWSMPDRLPAVPELQSAA